MKSTSFLTINLLGFVVSGPSDHLHEHSTNRIALWTAETAPCMYIKRPLPNKFGAGRLVRLTRFFGFWFFPKKNNIHQNTPLSLPLSHVPLPLSLWAGCNAETQIFKNTTQNKIQHKIQKLDGCRSVWEWEKGLVFGVGEFELCTLLHCDSWLNPKRIVAFCDCERTLLAAYEPRLARCFTVTLDG